MSNTTNHTTMKMTTNKMLHNTFVFTNKRGDELHVWASKQPGRATRYQMMFNDRHVWDAPGRDDLTRSMNRILRENLMTFDRVESQFDFITD